MEINHVFENNKGAFYIEKDGNRVAEMTYAQAGTDKIIIDHTEVSDSLKGQGIGYQLVEKAVDFARDTKIKILPLCPFAAAVFRKREDYKDVLF